MNIIVNADLDWGIGKDGQLLVHIKEDMQRFKQLTVGRVIVLGRKTLSTFPSGKPLPDRTNIILTHDRAFNVEGAMICHSLKELACCLEAYPSESVYVVGGSSIYQALLPFCQKAYVTRVHRRFQADSFFPNLDQHPDWILVQKEPVIKSFSRTIHSDEPIEFQFCLYQQTDPADLIKWIRERGEPIVNNQ